jgi:hypothetical protein
MPGDDGAGGAPVHSCDSKNQCAVGETCNAGTCNCTPCRSTGVPSPGGSCLAPVSAVAEGTYGGADVPAEAIDGDPSTAWGAGDYTGHLVISYDPPEAVAGIILLPAASPNSSIDYTILIEGPDGVDSTLTTSWKTTDEDPWVVAHLSAPRLVTALTIDAQSASTWISLYEVMTTNCRSRDGSR